MRLSWWANENVIFLRKQWMSAGDSGCICIIPLAEDNAAIENITISRNYTQVSDWLVKYILDVLEFWPQLWITSYAWLAGLQLAIRKMWWNYLSRQHFNSHLLLVYYTFCRVLFQMIDRAVSVTPAQFSGSNKYCMEWRKWGSWEWRRQHYYSSAAGHCCRTYQCAVIRRQHQVETAIWDQVVARKTFATFCWMQRWPAQNVFFCSTLLARQKTEGVRDETVTRAVPFQTQLHQRHFEIWSGWPAVNSDKQSSSTFKYPELGESCK